MRGNKSRQRFGSYKLWDGKGIYGGAYSNIWFWLVQMALMRYRWKNLPPSVSARWLELGLLNSGCMAFFMDDIGELRALNMTYNEMDMYNDPTRFTVYSYNFSAQESIATAVPVWSNWVRIPDILIINYYAQLMSDLRSTIVVNTKAQKTPILLLCDQKERLSVENAYQKYEGGAPVIYGKKDLLQSLLNGSNEETMKVLKTDAPFIADKIREIEQDYWNECLTHLGIDSTNRNKKDRYINSEILGDKGEMEKSRQIGLVPRQEAAEGVNRMFGYNIEVEYNTDVDSIAYMAAQMSLEDKREGTYQLGGI